MSRTFLALSLVLLAGSVLGVAAQSPDEGVILIPQGRVQSVPFKGLGGASVGNILVAYIERKSLNEVTIHGAGPGETSLELFDRAGRRKLLTIRVTSAAQAESHAPAAALATKPAAQAAPVVASAAPGLSDSVKPSDAVKPSGIAAPPRATPRVEVPRARRASKLPVAVEVKTEYSFDKEDTRVLSAELLKPGKLMEAASENIGEKLARGAEREQTITKRSSSQITTVSISVDIGEHNTLSGDVPYVRREDEVTAGGNSVKSRGRGLGDIQVSFEREQPRLFKTAWDGTAVFSVGLPTGKSIYNVGANESPLGSGHYEVAGIFGVNRVFDPFVVKASGGLIYTVPRTVQGTRIAPGIGYMAQTGFGVGLSDRWVLSEEMSFIRRPNVLLATSIDAGTETADQAYLKHALTYSPKGGHTLEVMSTFGLNPAAADYSIGFRWSYRRRGRDR